MEAAVQIVRQYFPDTPLSVSVIYLTPDDCIPTQGKYELAVFGMREAGMPEGYEDEDELAPDAYMQHYETREEVMIAYEYWCMRVRRFLKRQHQIPIGKEATIAPSAN